MPFNLNQLANQHFDLLVIGGGINGAGVARDAALRGIKTLLVEKGDFGSGTSSRSSRLIHGGVRYLEQFNFKLVFEACQERYRLRRLAPHLVWPLSFVIPIYKEDKRGPFMVRCGMTLYDVLALFRNVHPHRMLSKSRVLKLEPSLKEEGLLGGALYWDGQMNDARLCLENILSAEEAGAVCLNYVKANKIDLPIFPPPRWGRDGGGETLTPPPLPPPTLGRGKSQGVRFHVDLEDQFTHEKVHVTASVIVNAAGPWVDEVLALTGQKIDKKVRLSKGIHIVVPKLTSRHAILLSAQRDNRVFFIFPWRGYSLVGTTDTDFTGSPDEVYPSRQDMNYLLREVHRVVERQLLSYSDILGTYAGLRPLVNIPRGTASSVTREHRIDETLPNLFSVIGGKYTTYRLMAEQVVDRVIKRLCRGGVTPPIGSDQWARKPRPYIHCSTHRTLLYGGIGGSFKKFMLEEMERMAATDLVSFEQAHHLIRTYGSRSSDVFHLIQKDSQFAQPIHPALPYLQAEVLHAFQKEHARTLGDFLMRRSTLSSNFHQALESLPEMSRILTEPLGFSKETVQAQVGEFKGEVWKNMKVTVSRK